MYTIIGAGASGLSASIILASSGAKVKLIEKNAVPSERFGDSVQAIRNYEHDRDEIQYLKKLGLPLTNAHPIYKIKKYAPSLRSNLFYSKTKPVFYTIKRGPDTRSLDTQLLKIAESKDVEILSNTRASLSSCDIIASGHFFNNAFGFEFHFKDLNIDPETIHFFMDNNYAPNGYICVLPYGNKEATLLSTTFDLDFANTLKDRLLKFMQDNSLAQNLLSDGTITNESGSFVFYNVPKTAVIAGRPVVGEAAGFVEATRGYGLIYALLSGILAARSKIEQTNYDLLWKNEFEKELLSSFKRRLVYDTLTNKDYEKMISYEKSEISIEEYLTLKQKTNESFIKSFLRNTYVLKKLEARQVKYDLSRVI